MEIHRARTSHDFSFSLIGKEVVNTSLNVKHSNLTIDNRSNTPELILSPQISEIHTPYRKKKLSNIVQVNNTYNNNITIIHQDCKPSKFLNFKKDSIKQLKKSILKHKAIDINHTQIKIVKFKPEKLISEYEFNGKTGTENITQRSHHSVKSEQFHQLQQTASLISENVTDVNIDELKEQIDLLKKCIYEKKFGIFFGFCALAFKNSQNKNNDKLSIFINKNTISKNGKISLNYFGVHHGINGDSVSSYLKDNFHKFLFSQNSLSDDPIYTLFSSFEHFNEEIKSQIPSNCGSTFLSLLSLNNQIFISNIGSSKCIISLNSSLEIYSVNKTHTPKNESEMQRLRYYGVVFKKDIKSKGEKFIILPYNIHTTRIIGCAERNEKAILGYPEIVHIDTAKNQKIDFFIIVNDTISFFLNNKEIILLCYISMKESLEYKISYGKMLDNIVSQISKEAVTRGAKGNLSVIIIDNGALTKLHRDNNIKKVTELISQLQVSVMDFEGNFKNCETYSEKWYNAEKKQRYINKKNSLSYCVEKSDIKIEEEKKEEKVPECPKTKEPLQATNVDSEVKKKKKKLSFCSCFL